MAARSISLAVLFALLALRPAPALSSPLEEPAPAQVAGFAVDLDAMNGRGPVDRPDDSDVAESAPPFAAATARIEDRFAVVIEALKADTANLREFSRLTAKSR